MNDPYKYELPYQRYIWRFIFLIVLLNISGFSYTKMKWISNFEYKILTLETLPHTYFSNSNFNSPEQYLKKYPNCCNVYRYSGENSFNIIKALIFNFNVYVKIFYPIDNSNNSKLYQGEYFVNNKGVVDPVREIEIPNRLNDLNILTRFKG
jgi:hypothetical protein